MKSSAVGKRFYIQACIFIVALMAVGILGVLYLNSSPANLIPGMAASVKEREFTIRRGESFSEVLQNLNERQFIRSPFFLKIWSRIYGGAKEIKAGKYTLSSNMTALEIMEELRKGNAEETIRVVFPEGWTITQMGQRAQEKEIAGKNAFIKAAADQELISNRLIAGTTLQGYLYPDTYYVPVSYGAEKLIKLMVDTFFEKLEEIAPDYRELSDKALHEKIILASIVQREYRVDEEASLMASVFYNRLDIGMTLGSCATILYILTEELGKPHVNAISYEDIRIPSPFNTYQNRGLPPAPIASPGKTALKAVFNPASSDYLYFVVKDQATGTHTFSRSLNDHLGAQKEYIANYGSYLDRINGRVEG